MRQISNLEHYRILRSENSILLFFTKLLKNLEKQTYISLLLELMSNWIDMCLGIRKPEAMVINAFSLNWINNDFNMFHLSVLWVEHYWPASTSCIFDCHEEIWHCHTHTKKKVPPAMQNKKNKKKTVVNSSQSNDTTENYLHIASITIILNNGYLILKIYVMH